MHRDRVERRQETASDVTRNLPRSRMLDPRDPQAAAGAPLADSVNIPFDALERRMHELPPRDQQIQVGGPRPLAERVVTWLRERGRSATVCESPALDAAKTAAAPGRLWEPTAMLAELLSQISAGSAADLACGAGRDAVYLAAAGWHVVGVDHLDSALERARELARHYCVGFDPPRWLRADLESEAFVLEQRVDLVTCFRFLHRPLWARIRQYLRPHGHVICETFTTEHRARHGKPHGAAFVLEAGELPELFPGFRIRHFSEDWRGHAHTARLWAQLDD